MKQGVIISTFAAMTLFAACTKDSSLSPVASSTFATTTEANTARPITGAAAPNPNPLPSSNIYATVNYQLVTSQTSASPIRWKDGTMSLSMLGFDGYQNANDIQRFHFETPAKELLKLGTQNSLGTVTVDPRKYDAADLVLTLSPFEQSAALSLTGNILPMDGQGTAVPVQFIVSDLTRLTAKWRSQLGMNAGQVYNARLNLDLSQLTAGIPVSIIQNSLRTSGTVIISPTSNRDLYNMMMANLQNMFVVQLG